MFCQSVFPYAPCFSAHSHGIISVSILSFSYRMHGLFSLTPVLLPRACCQSDFPCAPCFSAYAHGILTASILPSCNVSVSSQPTFPRECPVLHSGARGGRRWGLEQPLALSNTEHAASQTFGNTVRTGGKGHPRCEGLK